MGKQSYLRFLIFCAVLSQGIAVISDENSDVSSSLHIRKKRVIDRTRNGGLPVQLSRAPYIVNILKNGVSHCAGTILAEDIIISTPFCVAERDGVTYMILSNSVLRNNGTPHHITRRSPREPFGFVVCQITPPIEFHLGHNTKIDLFLGPIRLYAAGEFSGWGCTSLDKPFSEHLMQTKLPIITNDECRERFGGPIPNAQICTLDTSRRRAACLGDEGGPLVYRNRLLGILLYRGSPTWIYPDVFYSFNSFNAHNLVNLHIHLVRGHQV